MDGEMWMAIRRDFGDMLDMFMHNYGLTLDDLIALLEQELIDLRTYGTYDGYKVI